MELLKRWFVESKGTVNVSTEYGYFFSSSPFKLVTVLLVVL